MGAIYDYQEGTEISAEHQAVTMGDAQSIANSREKPVIYVIGCERYVIAPDGGYRHATEGE